MIIITCFVNGYNRYKSFIFTGHRRFKIIPRLCINIIFVVVENKDILIRQNEITVRAIDRNPS